MKMAIFLKDLKLSASDRRQIQDRVRLALTRLSPLIHSLTVTISDENGLRGGVDKACRLVVRLRTGTVVVNEQAEAVLAAVTQAAERAARSVARLHHRFVDSRQAAPGAGHGDRRSRSAVRWAEN